MIKNIYDVTDIWSKKMKNSFSWKISLSGIYMYTGGGVKTGLLANINTNGINVGKGIYFYCPPCMYFFFVYSGYDKKKILFYVGSICIERCDGFIIFCSQISLFWKLMQVRWSRKSIVPHPLCDHFISKEPTKRSQGRWVPNANDLCIDVWLVIV